MPNAILKPAGVRGKSATTRALKGPVAKRSVAKTTPGFKTLGAEQVVSSKSTAPDFTRHILDFAAVATMPKLELIDMIRAGVPPGDFKEMVRRMDASQERVVKFLGVSTATINRKSARHENLSRDESARVIGLAVLIGQVQTMVDRSGDPEGFDAAKWVSDWLEQPVPALGGRKPADLMDTPPGQEMVSNLIVMMETGAYA